MALLSSEKDKRRENILSEGTPIWLRFHKRYVGKRSENLK